MSIGEIVSLILGGGAVATIAAFFKGVQALREGARAREKDAISDLEEWRSKANEARELAEAQRDYWRDKAGEYRFMLREQGVSLPPESPPTAVREISS